MPQTILPIFAISGINSINTYFFTAYSNPIETWPPGRPSPAPRKKPAKKEGAATAGYPAPANGEEDPFGRLDDFLTMHQGVAKEMGVPSGNLT